MPIENIRGKYPLTEGDLHVLQAEVVERDHADEYQRQRQHSGAGLQIVVHHWELVEEGLAAVGARNLSHVPQHLADDNGQHALIPTVHPPAQV